MHTGRSSSLQSRQFSGPRIRYLLANSDWIRPKFPPLIALIRCFADATAVPPGKILITGADGQVGRALATQFPDATLCNHSDFDLTADYQALEDAVNWDEYAVIINAAAYTAVDHAEMDRARCWAVNAAGPANWLGWQQIMILRWCIFLPIMYFPAMHLGIRMKPPRLLPVISMGRARLLGMPQSR